jgi:hypothetical protein
MKPQCSPSTLLSSVTQGGETTTAVRPHQERARACAAAPSAAPQRVVRSLWERFAAVRSSPHSLRSRLGRAQVQTTTEAERRLNLSCHVFGGSEQATG